MKKNILLTISILVTGTIGFAATYRVNNSGIYQRGKIKGIIFQIECPNGQTKQVCLSNEQMRELGRVVFNDALLNIVKVQYGICLIPDWKLNPTMILINVNADNSMRSDPYCHWKWQYDNSD